MSKTNSTADYNMSTLFLGHVDFINTTMSAPTTIHEDVAVSLRHTRFAVQTVLTPVVVIIGLLGNILNILVLLQPSMRSSTNIYILVLSFADSTYLVFNFALSILVCRKRGLSDSAYYFNPYGRFVSNFSGNVAVWVTVGFTVERYIAVCHPMHGKRWCTVSRAKLASVAIVMLTLINTLPSLFELEVVETEDGLRCQYTDFANQFSYEMVYSWWYVTMFTFVPLICLAIFNIILTRVLLVASRKRRDLVLISSTKKRSNQTGKTTIPTKGSANVERFKTHHNGVVSQGQLGTELLPPSQNNFNNKSSSSRLCANPQLKYQHQHGYQQQQQQQQQQLLNQQQTDSSTSHSRQSSTRSSTRSRNAGNGAGKDGGGGSPKSGDSTIKRQGKRMSREQNKVTLLLVTIVMIFFLSQLPWTALFLYKTYLSNNNLSGNQTHIKIAGNICNLLGLINASGNFYLYSCFSKRFRKTFKSLILFRRRKTNLFASMV